MPVAGEWIGDRRELTFMGTAQSETRNVRLHAESATHAAIAPNSLDAVVTDPPYFGNVQYAELMDFCYVWLRKLIGKEYSAFREASTRSPDELTGNETLGRGLHHFTEGLSTVFITMAPP